MVVGGKELPADQAAPSVTDKPLKGGHRQTPQGRTQTNSSREDTDTDTDTDKQVPVSQTNPSREDTDKLLRGGHRHKHKQASPSVTDKLLKGRL